MKTIHWKILGLCLILALALTFLPTLASAGEPEGAARVNVVAPEVKITQALPMMRATKFDAHLRAPHEGQIINMLREHKLLRPDAGPGEVRAAIDEFMREWTRRNPTTPNPEKFRQLLKNEQRAALTGRSPKAMGLAMQEPIKTMVALVEFPGTDTFIYSAEDPETGECFTETVTTSGPLHNEIPAPGPRDNFTVWYEDATPALYDELYFGTTGVIINHPNLGPVDCRGMTVANYYLEQSEGAFAPEGFVYPKWLQAAHSEGWYGADSCETGDTAVRSGDLIKEVVDLINADDPSFPWQDYDADSNGFVDNFTVIHAGMGQEAGGGLQGDFSIWSHASAIVPTGYLACAAGSAGCPDRDIYVREYSVDPENYDVGVGAEEYGHAAFGLPDIYTGDYQTSVAYWAIMEAGSWNGPLGGMQPAPFPSWFRYVVGWWDPVEVEYDGPDTEAVIGQFSLRPEGTEYGMKINLPDKEVTVPNPLETGKAWWSDLGDLIYHTLTHEFDLTGATAPITSSFASYWSIEEDWDYGYVEVSTDGGATWVVLDDMDDFFTDTNPHGNNKGWGLTGEGEGTLRFNLSAYKGKEILLRLAYSTDMGAQWEGWWADDFSLSDATGNLFSDDVEAGPGEWIADGWRIVPVTEISPVYYLVEWRNLSGFDEGLQYPYQSVWSSPTEFEVDRAPYTVPGMLLWLRDASYKFDYTLGDSWYDPPSLGPKHALIVVDSHPFPYMWDTVKYASGQNVRVSGRVVPADATFTLQETTPFTLRLGYDPATGEWVEEPIETKTFGPLPAVSEFHDSMGYYPGLWCCDPEGYLIFWDVDSSAVVPADDDYTTKITLDDNTPAYDLYGYDIGVTVLGSGNPGDNEVQFGLHLGVTDQADDGSWGKMRFWNSMKELDSSLEVDKTAAEKGDELAYTCLITQNIGSKLDALAVVPLDTKRVEYVPKSAFGGAVPMPCGFSTEDLAKLYASGGWGALRELASNSAGEIGSIVWIKSLGTGQGADPFGFSVKVKTVAGKIDMMASFYEEEEVFQTETADTVTVTAKIFLPLAFKSYPPPPAEVTILHTNDFHANIKPDTSNRGGSAYIAGYVNQVESEVGADNVVLLDAGDIMFGGTPFGPLTQGEAIIDLYNRMGYATATVGNHEFDKGQTLLETRVDQATFPFLAANVLVQGTNQQPSYLDPWTTVTVGGIKLGIIGLLTTETPDITVAGSTAGLEFQDPVQAVLRYYDEVKAASDAVILLTHEGVNDSGVNKGDKSVAQGLIAAGKPVDLIIGGHSHTNLSNKPVLVGNGVVTTTIVQAYYAGRQVGRVDATVDPATKTLTVTKWEGHAITTTITPDPDIAARVQYWDDQLKPLLSRPVGVSNVELIRNYNAESNVGDMVADSMRWKADMLDDGTVNGSVKIAFTNAGGLRADIVVPVGGSLPITITYGDTFSVLPFNNTLYTMDLTGDQIQKLLDQSAKLYAGILQASGIQHYWYNNCNCSTPTAWGAYGVKVGGELLVYTQTYRVVTNNFLASGGDSFSAFIQGINRRDTGSDMQEGFNEWIGVNSPLNNPADFGQRIVKLDKAVTILHTNDEHGRVYSELYRGVPQGLTYLYSLVKVERAKNPNVLLLSTGDTIQGNSFAFYFRNAPGPTPSGTTTLTNPMMAAMNMMGYDAFAIGNHEYNFGNQTFVKALSQAEFSMLGANVADDGRYGLASVPVEDYVTMDVEGLKVAVMGLTNPRVPSYELPSNIAGLTFTGGFEAAQTLVPQIIANEQPDLLVSLEHLGYSPYEGSRPEDTDVYLAQNLAGIDVIIGGHSHTMLDPGVVLTSTINPEGTLIAQANRYATYLGKTTVGYTGNITDGYKIVFRESRLLPASLVNPDSNLEALLAPYLAEVNAYTSQVIGESTVALDTRTAFSEETAGTNLQVDASKWALEQGGVAVDFHLSGAMTNASVPTGTLTVQNMFTLMPYENSLVVMQMNGPQIKAVLEKSFYNYDLWRQNKHRYTTCFLDVSKGGVITYNTTVPESGDNVMSLTINGVPVDFADASTYYNVSTVNYLAAGACSYSDAAGVSIWPLNQIVEDTQYYVRDAVIDYIKASTPVSPQVEGRIVFTQ